MRRMNSSAVLLFFVVHLTTSSLAAEIQIDEHTLCPVALHAFDAKDSAVIQDFFQFVQNVFNELDAQNNEGGERALNKRLADKTIAGPVVFGLCVQHPTATIYEEALAAYHSMRGLAVPLPSEPAKLPPPPSEGKPRFRNQ
jgi:hypothetical protein